jgi:hypothetical protein
MTLVILEDLTVRKMRFAFEDVRFFRQGFTYSSIPYWDDLAQELRLLPHVQCLLKSETETG